MILVLLWLNKEQWIQVSKILMISKKWTKKYPYTHTISSKKKKQSCFFRLFLLLKLCVLHVTFYLNATLLNLYDVTNPSWHPNHVHNMYDFTCRQSELFNQRIPRIHSLGHATCNQKCMEIRCSCPTSLVVKNLICATTTASCHL